ncbi:MAG: helicase associated domain-containing protein, partial [Clostridia bacterium]|nr:helicase associated domain-containing protein [Clostridia bacterium]
MTWEEMFLRAKEYYNQNGHLLVPKSYVCEDGVKLGAWVNTQRTVANGIRPGIMDEPRRKKLDSIGMDWFPNETAWNKGFDELRKYHELHGDCNVPLRYKSETGFQLGLWLQNQRRSFLKKGRGAITQEKIEILKSLGVVWEPYQEQWLRQYEIVKEYYETHGNTEIPIDYVIDGYNVARWLQTQRYILKGIEHGSLSPDQRVRLEALNELNISYGNKLELHWEEMYQYAKQYFEQYGHL